MVGAELSHIEIQFNHETCDGRSTRSRRFFLFLWFAVAAALFFLFSIRKCVVILEWIQLKVYVLEIFFQLSCCRIGLCPNRKLKSSTLQTSFIEKKNQLKNLRQKIYVKKILLPNLIHCLWQCKRKMRVVQDICFSYGVCIQYFLQ